MIDLIYAAMEAEEELSTPYT